MRLKPTLFAMAFGMIVFLAIAANWARPAPEKKPETAANAKPQLSWSNQPHPNFVKPTEAKLMKQLSRLQFNVTQHEGTEHPFTNEFWDEKRSGIYVDVVSGEPLFSSLDKFASGTGWPSFTRPLVAGNVAEKVDHKLSVSRTEVRSKHADSHLGHVFDDGPQPTGLRYCINSASLKFIPVESLERDGYGHFKDLFTTETPETKTGSAIDASNKQ